MNFDEIELQVHSIHSTELETNKEGEHAADIKPMSDECFGLVGGGSAIVLLG